MARPQDPTFVLDRSPHKRHASVVGSVQFDVLDDDAYAPLPGEDALCVVVRRELGRLTEALVFRASAHE